MLECDMLNSWDSVLVCMYIYTYMYKESLVLHTLWYSGSVGNHTVILQNAFIIKRFNFN